MYTKLYKLFSPTQSLSWSSLSILKYQEEKPWEDNMQANRQLWQEKVENQTYSVGPNF